jgi:hypothetical protein
MEASGSGLVRENATGGKLPCQIVQVYCAKAWGLPLGAAQFDDIPSLN